MTTDTSVKFFHSGMAGAPTLICAPGPLITVLDACLADGFAPNSIDSITIENGVGTIARSAGMPYEIDVVLQISGATYPTSLNSERRIRSVSTYAATFDASDLPDCVATGVLSVKIAPAGWIKLFSGTNLAVYQSADPKSTKCCLRVDDTGSSDARIVGYESMSDINTGLGQTPLAAQISGGGFWPKADSVNNPAREWVVFADGRTMYIWTSPFDNRAYQSRRITGHVFGFGDYIPRVRNDPFAWFVSAGNTGDTSFGAWLCSLSTVYKTLGSYRPRAENGSGASTAISRISKTKYDLAMTTRIAGEVGLPYPSPSDSALLITDLSIETTNDILGAFPGIGVPMQAIGVFGSRSKTNVDNRTLMSVPVSSSYTGATGSLLFDITGPWQ